MSLPFRFLLTIFIPSLFIVSVSATLLGCDDFKNLVTAEIHPVAQVFARAMLVKEYTIAHNKVRLILGMKPLTWNKTLEDYARRWAEQRIEDCELIHSPHSPYGENIFWSLKQWTPAEIVKVWADEYVYYDEKTNECINGQICGHYTQLIWKSTQQFGCAHVECKNNKGYFDICSYDPPGNYYYEGPFGGKFAKSIVYPKCDSTPYDRLLI
ncbi:hypothetical protein P3X46_003975 [Hevea brasiliensis]|uniref:SCP domain-containing protein n=1 Tax=Hevea brasiliensis TaxID=3981 RepID=A0ABQ9MXM5_HEVBR|nr:pathogenesis-related protein PR-1-like [Hevea brasiliensis]KAJ9184228.1 hypothetical protein P3X46_003975 [Hevea brasiliensis]